MSEPPETPYPHLLAPLQIGRHSLPTALARAGVAFDVSGGAHVASELDATQAISEGMQLAHAL